MNESLVPKKSVGQEVWEWVRLIVIAVLLALIIRTFVFTFVMVDGPSMQDLLYTDDVMFVSRIHYLVGEPQRGDVVMCHYPNSDRNFVKRVIGLPGETIECRERVVYINGVPLDEAYLTRENAYDFPPTQVLEGHYFVMGDNRTNSDDSRRVGAIERDQLVGRALMVIYPFDRIHVLPNHTAKE